MMQGVDEGRRLEIRGRGEAQQPMQNCDDGNLSSRKPRTCAYKELFGKI